MTKITERHSRLAPLLEFLTFLRRPRLLEPTGLRAPGALATWLAMLAIHLGVLLVVVMPVYGFWLTSFELSPPDSFGKVAPELLPGLAVLLAPIGEEMLFRGWQSGRPRALWLLACALVAIGALVLGQAANQPVATGLTLLALLIAAPIGWVRLRRQATPRWFAVAFPAIFYAVVALFAVVHFVNYPSASLLGLPLLLPQLWGALVLGYIRQRIGLIGAIIDHAVANAVVLAIAMMGG
jgi:membrane protease YdiL (CAAX protease family)